MPRARFCVTGALAALGLALTFACSPEIEARIPGEVEGHPVRVEVTGPIEPLAPDGSEH